MPFLSLAHMACGKHPEHLLHPINKKLPTDLWSKKAVFLELSVVNFVGGPNRPGYTCSSDYVMASCTITQLERDNCHVSRREQGLGSPLA